MTFTLKTSIGRQEVDGSVGNQESDIGAQLPVV